MHREGSCGRVASGLSFASRSDPRGPIFLYGVSFAPKGRFWSKLGVSKYRTIWLKTAVFPIWPRAKMGDFAPRKRPFFDPPKRGKNRYLGSPHTTQVKVTHQHSVVPWVGSALIKLRKKSWLQKKKRKKHEEVRM